MILKKYFYYFLLMLASVFMISSCCEDDVVSDDDEISVPNPAGDDFYMFVNGEWHENLTDTDITQGFKIKDVIDLVGQKINEVAQTMDEVITINKSFIHLYNGGQQANLDRVEEIVEELLADVNTKKDAYRAIGQMIGMGLTDDLVNLYMVFDGDEIHYTISPVNSSEEGEEGEEAAAKFSKRSLNKINWNKYKKYAPISRTADDVIENLVEGLGLDSDYLMLDEDLNEFIEKLENCTLDDLKEFIQDNVEWSLLPYCGDEYVQQLTDGNIQTTADYYNAMFDENFRYSLSYHFNQAFVSAETKEKFKAYGEELKSVFAKRIEKETWLSAQSKQVALEKLESMKFFFGWPDDEYTEEGFAKPKGELLVDDMLEVKMSRTRLIEAKLGMNPRDESMMIIMFYPGDNLSLTEYNAINVSFLNTVNIFPAFMIEPEFSLDMNLSENYVSLATLGHEMAHSFDCDGVKYGPDGSQVEWLTANDKATFDAMVAQFVDQISTLEALPGISQDGNITVNENMADLVGLNITFDALNECLKKNGVTGDELKEAQKDFFEYYAFRYRTNYSAEDIQSSLQDEHGLNKIRVNGVVQHMDSWYDLYNVVEENLLYLPNEERFTLW